MLWVIVLKIANLDVLPGCVGIIATRVNRHVIAEAGRIRRVVIRLMAADMEIEMKQGVAIRTGANPNINVLPISRVRFRFKSVVLR
jgi:hypothetical protein